MEIESIYQLGIDNIASARKLRISIAIPRRFSVPKSVIEAVGPAPLVDSIPAPLRACGRPSKRPAGIPPNIWGQWLRAVGSRGREDTPAAMAAWMFERAQRVRRAELRAACGIKRDVTRLPTVHWITIVPRRDLTEQLEHDWRNRIRRSRPGDPVYRIHLLGIQRREVR